MKYWLAVVMLVATATVLAQPAAIAPKHFDHADHQKRGVDTTKCEDCHRTDDKGTIMAPAAEIFARVNDLRQWEGWSPWAKLDPNAKVSFEGVDFI